MSELFKNVCRKEGVVTGLQNSYAYVAVESNDTCKACQSKILCGPTDSKQFKIKNLKNLKVGQIVQLEMDNGAVTVLAVVCYGFSLLFATLIALIAINIFNAPDIIAAAVFLISAFAWFVIVGKLLGNYTANRIRVQTQNPD